MWRRSIQFESIAWHSREMRTKKIESTQSGAASAFSFISFFSLSFQSFFHVVCLSSLLKSRFCVCYRHWNVYICHLLVRMKWKRTHARIHTRKKTCRTENRWISIGAFYFQTSRTSCHIMNINNDVTVHFVCFFFIHFASVLALNYECVGQNMYSLAPIGWNGIFVSFVFTPWKRNSLCHVSHRCVK